MNITKREKTLIVFVLILAICCGYYLYFFKPQSDQIDVISKSIDSKNVDIASNEQMQNVISQLDKEINDDQDKVVTYGSGITQGFDQPSILVYLQETVSKYADKKAFQFTNITPLGQLQVCPVSVTVECTYSNLKKLLSDLNNGKYLIKLASLDVNKHIEDETANPETSSAPATKSTKSKTASATATPAPSASNAQKDILEVTLSLEFYNYKGDVPSDNTYPFVTSSIQYGGDIFN
jgi:hypothetical protein